MLPEAIASTGGRHSCHTSSKDPHMSMYLPNPDLQPTGYEAVEFLDDAPMADTPPVVPAGDEGEEPGPQPRP